MKKIILTLIILVAIAYPAYAKGKKVTVNLEQPQTKSSKTKQPKVEQSVQDGPLEITLQGVVSTFVNKNIDLNIARLNIQHAKATYLRSYSNFLPSVRTLISAEKFDGGEVIYFSEPVELKRTTLRPTIAADYQIFTGGKPFFERGKYKNYYEGSKKAYERAYQKALLDSTIAYYDWLNTFTKLDTKIQLLNEANEQLEQKKNRFVTGFGTNLEVLQTKTLVYERKNEVLEAQNQKDLSEIALKNNLNIGFLTPIKPLESSITPLIGDDKETLISLYDKAQKNRPDIAELEYNIRAAKSELKSVYSEFLPTIGVSTYVRGIGPNMDNLTRTLDGVVSFNVDLMKYFGVNLYGNIKEVKARLAQAVLNKEKQLDNCYREIAQAYYANKLSKDQLELAKEKIDTAETGYKIIQARLEAGKSMKTDIEKAKSNLQQALLDYQTAVVNNNISQLKLLYAIGMLTPDGVLACVKKK